MSFMWPQMLWLLLLLPVLVGAYILVLRRKRKQVLRYSALTVISRAAAKRPGFKRHVPALLMGLAALVSIVALSRPSAVIVLPSQQGTIILAMDISGSMRAEDVEPSRLAAAQSAARQFVRDQPENVRIGVVVFAGSAAVAQAPTTNKEDVLSALDRFRTQIGTAIGSAILSSLDAIYEDLDIPLSFQPTGRGTPLGAIEDIERPQIDPVAPGSNQSAVVVLITDGQATHGPDPIQAAELARDLGIRVFTVGLGTPEGVVLGYGGRSFRVVLDEETLTAVAEKTAARYFKANTETDLVEIYDSLQSDLVFEQDETELTVFFTAAALLFVLAGAGLSLLWFGRIT